MASLTVKENVHLLLSLFLEVELTEEEREENVRLLEEIVEAEFPFDEMADPTFRDKVLTFFVALCLYMKGSKFLSQDRERVMKAWLLSVVDEAGPGDLSDIPHFCHRHHRRCLCKFFLPGVIFFQIEREKLAFYCIVYNNLRPSV